MQIGEIREQAPGERRVALTPELVTALVAGGATVVVEAGAGEAGGFMDAAYRDAGASGVCGNGGAGRREERQMTSTLVIGAYVFVLAVFIGIDLIGKVPQMLHTPLMSGTNAIHGIVLVGAILVAGGRRGPVGRADRAVRRRPRDDECRRRLRGHRPNAGDVPRAGADGAQIMNLLPASLVELAYLVTAVTFIIGIKIGIKRLDSPAPPAPAINWRR
jgi:hypothetical protein